MKGWKAVGKHKSWLIRAPKSVGSGARAIHGISDEYLARYGDMPKLAHDQLLKFIDDRPFGAFNLPFDQRMLAGDWKRLKISRSKQPEPAICALRLSRLFVVDAESYRLESIAEHCRLRNRPKHRAHHDVKTTVELLDRIIAIRAPGYSFQQFQELCEMPIKDARDLVG
jgi:DNA polymerase III epsilon subunit-like protein